MAKSKEKFLARSLRKKGLSLKEISKKLKVSKGSVSVWCSDIKLTEKQIKKLHAQMVRGSYKGRMIGARMQRDRKIKRIQDCLEQGKKDIPRLKKRELFIAGLGLYWGEGSKKDVVCFFNSDPTAIRFMMNWFRIIFGIKEKRFYMYLNINKDHKNRQKEIIKYWSDVVGVPVQQFRKPSLVKTKHKKIYNNSSEYHGTLCIRIAKSRDFLYQIQGWIKAMGQGSSVG